MHRLSDGRPRYTRALLDEMIAQRKEGAADPISALAASLSPNGELDGRCRFSYELRLHRARGYGALKAILQVLSEEEPLTLTQIAQRLDRTAGSTKDYLSWLQDVDMLTCSASATRSPIRSCASGSASTAIPSRRPKNGSRAKCRPTR